MIDFPATPSINQVFTAGDQSWTWDGTVWLTITPPPTGGIWAALAGATFTGQANGITPTAAANLTRKDYVDGAVASVAAAALPLLGGTMTGQIITIAPVAGNNAANRTYVDTQVATKQDQAQADLRYLQLTGGTVSGQIKGVTPLFADDLTRKDYVDTQVATRLTPAQGDATYAALVHTHPLSQLQQSGAAQGQIATWNGASWSAADVPTSTSLTGEWRFDSAVNTAQDPGNGDFRLSSGVWASITSVALSQLNAKGTDTANYLSRIKIGSKFYCQDQSDSTRYGKFNVTSTPVDNGAWWSFNVSLIESGVETMIPNNSAGIITFVVDASAADASTYVTIAADQSITGIKTFTAQITVSNTGSPQLILNDTDGTAGTAIPRLVYQGSGSDIGRIGYSGGILQVFNNDGNVQIGSDVNNTQASSAILLQVDGTAAARVEPAGIAVPTTITVMTREKGDNRYALKAAVALLPDLQAQVADLMARVAALEA